MIVMLVQTHHDQEIIQAESFEIDEEKALHFYECFGYAVVTYPSEMWVSFQEVQIIQEG